MTCRARPTPEEAFMHYLKLGAGRSLTKLRETYIGQINPVPNLRTLIRWSSEGGWKARAREFEAQVSGLVQTLAIEGVLLWEV